MKRTAVHLRTFLRMLFGRPRHRRPFEQVFANFREVLDRNNRSLEIITDMGDTLGGDYLFDIQYVRRSYDELRAAMNGSLQSFTRLTEDRYPQLDEVLAAIDERIRHGIEETFPESKELVLPYDRITGDRLREVGGKNANLAELRNVVKLAVPDGFAVTTAAFDLFMRHNRFFEKAGLSEENGPLSGDALRELYETVLHGAMPPELGRALEQAVQQLQSRCDGTCSIAVRSSAGEEDGEFSFAGQFDTILNVPLEAQEVEKAYRKVIASPFSGKSSLYQTRMGLGLKDMQMAVACVVMVDAAVSGVLYSRDPGGDRDRMVISATWGLGAAMVEGQAGADLFFVSREGDHELAGTEIGSKHFTLVPAAGKGVASVSTPIDKQKMPSLLSGQAAELARLALRVETHYRRPQDIEWAIDGQGKIVLLQTRPLRTIETRSPAAGERTAPARPVIATGLGVAVQKGAAAGTVFVLKNERDLDAIPRGAILVARHDSSQFVRVMTGVSAIITGTGAPTSHMAALCREFRVPTVVNAAAALELLETGQEITITVDDGGATLYAGADHPFAARATRDDSTMEELFEFRKKRYLLRSIVPLNLIDPLRDEFTPQACRTLHDILRFIHEKSVASLIEYAEHGVRSGTVRLDLPIPAGITLIDIGGGLNNPSRADHVPAEQITSAPLRAVVNGMTRPGTWRSDAVPMEVNDFMSSMLRVPDLSEQNGRVETNMAVISGEYAHISLKFGYHFIVLDCFCSSNARNNHIYFRFAGGATDMSKRSRRLQLIALILEHYGFTMGTKGDLIVARLANMPQAEMLVVLDQLGRLISFTRQLDAVLNDDQAVKYYVQSFLDGSYAYAGSSAQS